MTPDKAILITRKTRLDELIVRFNTRLQAKFYVEANGGDFSDYEAEYESYQRALETVTQKLTRLLKIQVIDRSFAPNFIFANEIILCLGQDGIVANAAKYVGGRPLIGINPEPERFDGLLLPFDATTFVRGVESVLEERARIQRVTFAEARLQDGQRLLAFNDLFIGAASHVSARYRISHALKSEQQSSSGIIVSTGAGSTGWMSSLFNMARGVERFSGGIAAATDFRMEWDAQRLVFIVREPFASRTSQATLVAGHIEPNRELTLESLITRGGVIFSDGVESDFLQFNAGSTATVGLANEFAQMVTA